MKMNKILKIVVILGIISTLASGLYSNGIFVNSVGTKSISMGGAFIGLADDYSAVFWNPAGLIQMEKSSLALCVDFVRPGVTYKTSPFFSSYGLPDIDAKTKKKVYPIPFAGYFKAVSEKIVVGFALYAPTGIGAEWNGSDLTTLTFPDPTVYKWKNAIFAVTAAPVIAFKLSDVFSIGTALNLNYGVLDGIMPMPVQGQYGQYSEKIKGVGFGATIGALLKPADFLSIGITFRTPSKLKLSGHADMPGVELPGFTATNKVERELTLPMWAGIGFAVKPIDNLIITADAQWNNTKKMDVIGVTYTDARWQELFAQSMSMNLSWKNSLQWRFGLEYMLTKHFALRAGYFIDPAPGPQTRLNILLPSPDGSWLTLGWGIKMDKFNLDIAGQYNVWGKDRDADIDAAVQGLAMPGTHGANILTLTAAFTYKF
ncbi:MAG: hypothetical protein GTN53_35015 [Candidatus Aminicenantes bacterium]|nr:hypothetical protein [Candidatus Aminicenantes bacterium]NIQ71692.1 hypothetical protein [Candidatus Aminicenantes bacterium]NIT27726.1 hypothetical protein [Candidatus Aminicenantes bacterium]